MKSILTIFALILLSVLTVIAPAQTLSATSGLSSPGAGDTFDCNGNNTTNVTVTASNMLVKIDGNANDTYQPSWSFEISVAGSPFDHFTSGTIADSGITSVTLPAGGHWERGPQTNPSATASVTVHWGSTNFLSHSATAHSHITVAIIGVADGDSTTTHNFTLNP